ncbi:TPA: hypothetical protein ACGN8S_005209 [Bacillus cereus]
MKITGCLFNPLFIELNIEFSRCEFTQIDDALKKRIKNYAKDLMKVYGYNKDLQFTHFFRIHEDYSIICTLIDLNELKRANKVQKEFKDSLCCM